MYRNFLVPTDGSPRANKALKAAIRMARAGGGKLHVLNVQPSYLSILALAPEAPLSMSKTRFDADMRRLSGRILAAAQRLARAHGVKCGVIEVSSASIPRSIVRTAKSIRADLIVMASHGRGPIASLLLGSATQKVLAGCRIPVLVHR